jgi:hypothetical protein
MEITFSPYSSQRPLSETAPRIPVAKEALTTRSAMTMPVDMVVTSSFGGRLGKAATHFASQTAALSRDQLGDKVRATITAITYPLTPENIAAKGGELPTPQDSSALASAGAASAYFV